MIDSTRYIFFLFILIVLINENLTKIYPPTQISLALSLILTKLTIICENNRKILEKKFKEFTLNKLKSLILGSLFYWSLKLRENFTIFYRMSL
ncbi:hypothetical protein BpHYR1_017310 [Brachionus plicatilis]|uniref:Uncharacterized protein n=1 Tax=Brachionus plicatilis TaxID=10195 RepID=A0A3M7R565_BRAPC|nr:hypothetical protein BpHYR1_017310 [Brachionus plicatilis]